MEYVAGFEYVAEFSLFRISGEEIPEETLTSLTDDWVMLVESRGLLTGGGIRPYTRVDGICNALYKILWRIKRWVDPNNR